MKVYKIGDNVINLEMVKHIRVYSTDIGFYFSDPSDWVRIDMPKKEGLKILQECYEIMKKED